MKPVDLSNWKWIPQRKVLLAGFHWRVDPLFEEIKSPDRLTVVKLAGWGVQSERTKSKKGNTQKAEPEHDPRPNFAPRASSM